MYSLILCLLGTITFPRIVVSVSEIQQFPNASSHRQLQLKNWECKWDKHKKKSICDGKSEGNSEETVVSAVSNNRPRVGEDCVACFGEMTGTDIATTTYSGFSTELKDLSCAQNCRAHPGCEFWVRSVSTSACWLKQGFRAYEETEPSADRRGGFVKPESELGVVFIKQPKTGGETLAEVLAQYAVKYGRKQLHDKRCYHKRNPLGQSICACDVHFVALDSQHLPNLDPLMQPRATMVYTHMFYSPQILGHFMPAHAVKRRITILRRPLDVLKSAQKMAVLQRHSKSQQERSLNNSFCQYLAHDTFQWLTKCPMASVGDSSIHSYLDPDGHAALSQLLHEARKTLTQPNPKLVANSLTLALSRLDHEFAVGLQSSYEASVLLFEAALGWDRVDTVYSLDSMVLHAYDRKDPFVVRLEAEWLARKDDIPAVLKQRFSPVEYDNLLFEHGEKVHAEQLQRYVGDADEVERQVLKFKSQNKKFTVCYENQRRNRGNFNTCTQAGLQEAATARRLCTGWIRKEQRFKFTEEIDRPP